MNQDIHALIHGYLDGILTEHQEAELNAWVKESPANGRLFAEAAGLHDRLHDVIQAQRSIDSVRNQPAGLAMPAALKRPLRYRRLTILGGLTALTAVILLVMWWSAPLPLSAATELDRLIEASSENRDRSYVIRNLDPRPEQPDERRPPIDGATLYVRHPDQYVLIRRLPDGRKFVTGSDGERSWSAPPDGAVRVSGDPMRFRGPVPGHQHGIPFINLRFDLVELRDAYVVTVLGPDAIGRRGLQAEKKSPDYRGPKRVEIWYDAKTGVIHRMVFDGMPRARGGPNRVAVELLEQRNLGANFFRHESHHEPGRRVIEED